MAISLLIFSVTAFHTTHHRPHRHQPVSSVVRDRNDVGASNEKAIVETAIFNHSNPPFLAVITESYSCDSDSNVHAALDALYKAVSTDDVDLVSVRVDAVCQETDAVRHCLHQARLEQLVRQLVAWSDISDGKKNRFRVVVSSDWIEAGIRAGAHGVHFKERHRDRIPATRDLYRHTHNTDDRADPLLVGTSTHSVASALSAWEACRPDYIFAGTCFATLSHPEKSNANDLEGPALPALVAKALTEHLSTTSGGTHSQRPPVFAIGGMDTTNCQDQVTKGSYVPDSNADGIATIRTVLKSSDPAGTVRLIKQLLTFQAI